MMDSLWQVTQDQFDPGKQHHMETIFTIGNGYLCTRGAFEEGYPKDSRATFIHGVFDEAPIVYTELANAPDWLPLEVLLNGERFSLDTGLVESFHRELDLRSGVLQRTVHWRSPSGLRAQLHFERFASLADPHLLLLRCRVRPAFEGSVTFRAALNGNMDNQGLAHWEWLGQGAMGETIYLHNRTRSSQLEHAAAMRFIGVAGRQAGSYFWDVENRPTRVIEMAASPGQEMIVDKWVSVYTTRDSSKPRQSAIEALQRIVDWPAAFEANANAWKGEWERSDVTIEGDPEAQLALRFNLFHLLIAAPRHDEQVNIGAKTLSGFGYRGHSFWDTEIFMLPLFTFTAPHIAKNLLNYRHHNLPGARQKARANGFEGAQFPWESADSGEEVTPSFVPHFKDRSRLVRIWTGDIEIHISADIAYAAHQFWKLTGDDAWMAEKGAELILDTAKFWGSRAEWNAALGRYETSDVIGPDEYHEHVDNNAFTNRMAAWNLETALEIYQWLKAYAPQRAQELADSLDLTPERLAKWRDICAKMYIPGGPGGIIEQFEGYFERQAVDLAALEPRSKSIQELFGIEETNQTQVLKQPDVLMMLYLLADDYPEEAVLANYDYYTPRTDHTYGSSLGPSMQAIMACRVGKPDEAYEHFIRAARADLRDVRGNAGDGIHAASAAGTWQAAVFGFGGLRVHAAGWEVKPQLPAHWRRLAFKFYYQGELQTIDIRPEAQDGN
jgi:trehalose/maltose hydrolase-like predicted phosphorylase